MFEKDSIGKDFAIIIIMITLACIGGYYLISFIGDLMKGI